MPSDNAAPPEQSTATVPQIVMAIHSGAGQDRNTVDSVPAHGLQAVHQVPNLKRVNRAILQAASRFPNGPGASDIRSIEEDRQPRGQSIRANYDTLLVTNTPSSVEALGEPHNIAWVKQVDRITILLNLNNSGNNHLGVATAYWEDYVAGSCGYEALYSGYLATETEEDYDGPDRTGFINSLRGQHLCDELIRLQDSAYGTKELTFITIRGPRDTEYNPRGRYTVSPHAESYLNGAGDGDIPLKCIKALAVLQREDVPLRIIMEGTLPERENVASFLTEETGSPVLVEGLVREEA